MSEDKAKKTGRVVVQDEDPEFVIISLTRAFCPNGHPLIAPEDHAFYGMPGLKLAVAQGEKRDLVTISAVHGDHRRVGGSSLVDGKRCSVTCPECSVELPTWDEGCRCGQGKLRMIYLTPELDSGNVVLICDVWSCYRSRVVDKWELLSEFVEQETDD